MLEMRDKGEHSVAVVNDSSGPGCKATEHPESLNVGSKRRSQVWHYFDEPVKGKAICKYCHKVYLAKSANGTSTLKKHADKCVKRKRLGGGRQKSLLHFLAKSAKDPQFDPKHSVENHETSIVINTDDVLT